MIGGVCAGFAEYFNIDATIVRIAWLFILIFGGFVFGFIAYLACLFIIKENPVQDPTVPKKTPNTSVIIGAALVLLGLAIISSKFDWGWHDLRPEFWHTFQPFFSWGRLWPLIIILIGVFYLYNVTQRDKGEHASMKNNRHLAAKKFTRSNKERIFGGICGGLAEYINIDPVLLRIVFVVITLSTGIIFGVILYIVLMFIIPENDSYHDEALPKNARTQMSADASVNDSDHNDEKRSS
jgi:phage shock protein C